MKFDLHIHSTFSGDSKTTPKQIIDLAEEKGMDGIAIIDHNTIEGYQKAVQYETDLILVPGIEVSAPEGHVIALGLQKEIGRQQSVGSAIDEVRSRGALAIAAHPYRFWSGVGEEVLRRHEWDGIEGMNGRGWKFRNEQAQGLAEEMDLPITGGSDSHQPKTVGKSYTIVDKVDSWEELLQEIRNKRTGVGGQHCTLTQTFFYVRRAFFGWVGRGFKKI